MDETKTRPTHYKKVIPSKISLLPPIKNKESRSYESQIVYDKDLDLVIQTPGIVFNENAGSMKFSFSEEKSPEFCLFLSELRESVVNTLVAKSESFFKGKIFSYEEILDRFNELYVETLQGSDVNYNKMSNFFIENAGDSETLPGNKSQCILKFEKIIFDKSKITLSARILKFKALYKQKFSVAEECIFEDDSCEAENDELC